MWSKRFAVVAVMAGLGAAVAAGAESVAVLLHKGIYQEETVGDLDAAMKIYQQIVADEKVNRPHVAQARYRLGMCYLKKGQKEKAVGAFRKLIEGLPQHTELANQARTRLSPLGQPTAGAVVRQVCAEVPGYPAALSRNGKYVAHTDWQTGDIAIRELVTGETRRVTNKGSWKESKEYGWGPVFSPDDKQLAYSWLVKLGRFQLRIINSDGSRLRVLASDMNVELADWSPDGKELLGVLFESPDGPYKLGLFSVEDGSMRVLKTYQSPSWGRIRFSPDGRFIACRVPQKAPRIVGNTSLIRVDDGKEMPLIEHPTDDRFLGWAPDGKRLAFFSSRTGGMRGVWILEVRDGRPQSNPELVKKVEEECLYALGLAYYPIGMARDGSFYFGLPARQTSKILIATLDPRTGEVVKPPAPLAIQVEGHISSPEWSPGGAQVAFRLAHPRRGDLLGIHSLETGKSREIITDRELTLAGAGPLRWSPDGRYLLCRGRTDRRHGVLQVDVDSGEVTRIADGHSRAFAWAPDGKAVYFARLAGTGDGAFFRKDLESSRVTELFQLPRYFFLCEVSPDGKQVAYADVDEGVIKVVPITGREPRVVARVRAVNTMAWTPDMRYLLFGRPGQRGIHLWRVAVEGGEPQELDIAAHFLKQIRIHPDGRQIIFSGRQLPPKFAIWVMENFLPGRDAD